MSVEMSAGRSAAHAGPVSVFTRLRNIAVPVRSADVRGRRHDRVGFRRSPGPVRSGRRDRRLRGRFNRATVQLISD